jgi:SAM-dependent methyltransferase
VTSAALLEVVRCPDCASALVAADRASVRCPSCGRVFDDSAGYLDLTPTAAFAERTKYLDEALHTDARHASVAPPLLGSKIRHDMLRRFLELGPADRVLDLGCGSGRELVWNADTRAAMTGVTSARSSRARRSPASTLCWAICAGCR